ncbi:phage T4 tail fiber protein [Xenorhabdus cabanillasii]|uniref:Phage T4 tail fiber protein n=1 Tax=Xenorhabdus cabanillasii TaxID=351673 RepID=A0A3D9U9T6_9GAMM|nr:phage tail protein [Xenorhabdus cabanillasii]REF26036.1 phage T4 tail fiber protein [Xenorhabdus cabanillasii]
MSSVITVDFEKWKAQQVAAGNAVVLDEFVFANVPDLDLSQAISRSEPLPAAQYIVHRQAVNKTGLASENAVAYSVTLGTEVGNFDFNWIGLINKTSGVIGMITHAPTQKKIKTANGLQGNVLTRSFLLEFAGAAVETAITTTAETWQIDFTARLSGMDEMQRLINTDSYGEAAFFDDGFAVVRQGEKYLVKKGLAYVGGLRGVLEFDQTLNSMRNTRVYADFSYQGNLVSQWKTVVKITVSNELKNYVDATGYPHYVFAVASIDDNGNVIDLRPKGALSDRDIADLQKTLGKVQQDYATKSELSNGLNEKQHKGDYATNPALQAVNDNANNRLAMHLNGADIPDRNAFVNNLGLSDTVERAQNSLDKRTGGNINGAISAPQVFSESLFSLGYGERNGMRSGAVDDASFEGNNLEILSWFGIGFKASIDQKTRIFLNTRSGLIATKGDIRAEKMLYAGDAVLTPWGDISGSTWGGFLSHWIDKHYAKKSSGVLGDNGWLKDESTGLIMQWGIESSSNRNFNFPRAFDEKCFAVFVTNTSSQGWRIDNAFGYPISQAEFFAATKNDEGKVGSFSIAWWAIGK